MDDINKNLMDHEYDGIQEFNNPLPLWWLGIFIGTVIFAFIYWIHYEIAGAPTQLAELKSDLAVIAEMKKNSPGSGAADTEDDLLKLISSQEALAAGKLVYDSKCAACHGVELQGIIGPNLVDDYWIHGQGKLAQMSVTVRQGVLDKGMPGWESVLNSDEIRSVVAFIGSNRGAKPANAKAPQGEKIAVE
ncbi:MAG: hypothetical protein A2622_00340 [Bdellovibrionales bacterium RIFCSPHIGHO2_01_FULL_40_29]|nr:MAG: hypothetical protein A2622_00340 [Bdellovibrionales bacterium RIFCSPHIGHO2_01_FULL_40_29]OFZ32573.1 MAG: hypothetical protein A3D17_04940 [Bdellovibrionales bacterium RIFCSPHIGHO2_02_FULL_40_15]